MDNLLLPIQEKISKKLENTHFNLKTHKNNEFLFSNKQTMFEQYKLLVDSAHKTEERRNSSNSIFLSVNTLLASFLVHPLKLTELATQDMLLLSVLILIGAFISWEWIKVIASYKMLNLVNYSMIKACEKLLPLFVFSLRAEIEAEQEQKRSSDRANIILIKENFLPKSFLFFYITYFLTLLIYFKPFTNI